MSSGAEVAKLADAPDLGSGVERRASSSLALGTSKLNADVLSALFVYGDSGSLAFDFCILLGYPFFR